MIVEFIVLGVAVTGVSIAAVVAKSLSFARGVLDDEKVERERRRADLPTREPQFFDDLPVRQNLGQLDSCPYCSRRSGNDENGYTTKKQLVTYAWIMRRSRGKLIVEILEEMYKDGRTGPTAPIAHVDAPDGPMLFQACCSCGSEWLVRPK